MRRLWPARKTLLLKDAPAIFERRSNPLSRLPCGAAVFISPNDGRFAGNQEGFRPHSGV
jgi:hypothetical protein